MTTPEEIAVVMSAATAGEQRRREVASERPGHGSPLPLEQPPSSAGVGLSDVAMPVTGEGYSAVAEISAAVQKAYGPDRPVYADPTVGGVGFQAGRQEPAVRHVTDLGDGRLFIEGRSAPAGDGVIVASVASARPSLWARLFRRNVQR